MPEYLFRAKDGEERLEFFHGGKAPSIGDKIRRKGKAFTRMPSMPQAKVQRDVHFVAWSQEKNKPGAPHYTDSGFPAFDSKRSAQEFAARYGGSYGGDG